MSNYTTRQTALKLKEAGFPQPTPEFGQVWYSERDTPYLVYNILNGRPFFIEADQSQAWVPIVDFQNIMTFAPTATDILAQLPFSHALHCERIDGSLRFYVFSLALSFADTLRKEGWKIIDHSYHENPAEACAIDWLKTETT